VDQEVLRMMGKFLGALWHCLSFRALMTSVTMIFIIILKTFTKFLARVSCRNGVVSEGNGFISLPPSLPLGLPVLNFVVPLP